MKDKILDQAAKTLKCDMGFLLSLEKNNSMDDREREIANIFNNYYYFLNSVESVNFIEKMLTILRKYNFYFVKDEIDYTTLAIIIFKGFCLKNFPFSKEGEKFIDSSEIYNFVKYQYKNYLIFLSIKINEKKIDTLVIHVLDILIEEGLVKQKLIILKHPTYKSIKYFYAEYKFYTKKIEEFFDFSFYEFELLEVNNETFLKGLHYSKFYELYRKNILSNKSFKITNNAYLKKKINLKLFVDEEYQKDFTNLLKNEKILEKEEIIKKNSELGLLFNDINWSVNTRKNMRTLQSEISQGINKLIERSFAETRFVKGTYLIFPIFLDFRGRKYYRSVIGPTSSKCLRLGYYYGFYNNDDFDEKNNKYSLKYYNEIGSFCCDYNLENDKKFYETYYWCLIGIGKFFVPKDSFPIKERIFIEKAISNFNNEKYLKLEHLLEIRHYKRIMLSLKTLEIKKRPIIKDATASIYQIFMKILRPLNENSLKYVNLGNENEWYDTYSICAFYFYTFIKEKNIHEEFHVLEKFNKYFKRKLIKNTVMTIPYSAGFDLCWSNYKINFKEQENEKISENSVKKIYKAFYFFIKNIFDAKVLYKSSTQSKIDAINEEFEIWRKLILQSSSGDTDIAYFKTRDKALDKKYFINGVNKRVTRLMKEVTDAIDVSAFNKASGANLAHFRDAEEVREIEISLNYCIITIHDSFLIDFNNCTKLIEIKISIYQNNLNKHELGFIISNNFILL